MVKEYTIQDFLNIKGAGGVSISPDSKEVIFQNSDSGTSQVYRISINGGEKEQLTHYNEPIQFCIYSPVADQFIFGKDKGGNELAQFYLFDIKTKKVELLTEKDNVSRYFGTWSNDGKLISYASNERNEKDFDVYIMNIETRETELVFQNDGSCMAAGFSYQGDKLLVIKEHNNFNQDIFVIDLKTKKAECLTKHEGNARYFCVQWVKDGSGFYLVSDQDQDLTGLFFYDLDKKKLIPKLNFKFPVECFSLNKKEDIMIVSVNENGYSSQKVYSTNNFKELESIFPLGIYSNPPRLPMPRWSNNDRYVVFDFQNSVKRPEVYVLDWQSNKINKITNSSCKIQEDLFVEPELISYKTFDGLDIPAYIYLPKKLNKFPAIVYVHGGPEDQIRPGFAPLFQYFLYKGFALICPNVRGSTGYGKNYQALDDREKRLDSVKDLEFLNKYLKERKDIENNKIGLYGGSYGGYMVLAGLAFQPELWSVGVDMCGISNFVTFLQNTAKYRRSLREAEYGYLEKDKEMLERFSPINSIDKIKAPLLIIHGRNDPRVPISEAEQIYSKLKELGRDAHLLVYEDEGHNLLKLKNRLDAYPKIVDFLDKHLK